MNFRTHLYIALGKLDEACRLLDEKERSTPKYLNLQAVCAIEKGDLDSAKAFLQRAYAQNPYSTGILNNLGNIKLLSQEPRLASEYHLRAAQASPLSPIPRYNLTLSYQACGEFEKALSAYCDYKFLDSLTRWTKILLIGLCLFGAAMLFL